MRFWRKNYQRRSHALRGVEDGAAGDSVKRHLLARHVSPLGGLVRRLVGGAAVR
jgi:hypothetical protein